MNKSYIESIFPWDKTNYEAALQLQKELSSQGHVGWILFSCPPTITLGVRSNKNDILFSHQAIQDLGVQVLSVSRGGQATYHGPGQIIGFPVGPLCEHVGHPRAVKKFIYFIKKQLEEFIESNCFNKENLKQKILKNHRPDGVWIQEAGVPKKCASFGYRFCRSHIEHGFALNIQPTALRGFHLIRPCGGHADQISSIYKTQKSKNDFHVLRLRLEKYLLKNIAFLKNLQ